MKEIKIQNLPPCDPDLFKSGTLMTVVHTVSAAGIEAWVKSIAKLSGQPVDWHFAGGRAQVLASGDISKVEAAIKYLQPVFDKAYAEASAEIMGDKP